MDTLRVRQAGNGDVDINAVALVQRWSPTARPDLQRALHAKLRQPFRLNIDQLVVGHDTPIAAQPVQALTMDALQAVQQRLARDEAANGLRAHIERAAAIPLRDIAVDANGTQAVLYGAGTPGMTVAVAAAAESRLRQQFPRVDITVIPAVSALPPISFALGKATPDTAGMQALATARWALTRWQVSHVMATGYASTPRERRGFDNLELARRSAASVGNWLRTAGFQVTERADYPVDGQRRLERDQGITPFQVARVTLDNAQAASTTP